MPTNKKIPPHIKTRIVELYLEMRQRDPETNAATVADAIRSELQKRNTWLARDNQKWPSDSVVRKILVPVRKDIDAKGLDPDERPWSIMASSDGRVPPDALPDITRAWAASMRLDPSNPLTIRDALWVARIRHLGPKEGVGLFLNARTYSYAERALQAISRYPNTPSEAPQYWVKDLDALSTLTRHDVAWEEFFAVFDLVYSRDTPAHRQEARQRFEDVAKWDSMTPEEVQAELRRLQEALEKGDPSSTDMTAILQETWRQSAILKPSPETVETERGGRDSER
ncbi:MAG: hypothetical protein JW846_01460 [Dehalococcoidia bacterium]|nr:hypothetical protein [Dehalococcoidia bacterium]